MRILMVPSWYPSEENPYNGSFFREQAQMLRDAGHEVAVLALSQTPLQQWNPRAGFEVAEEEGLRVLRGTVPMFPRGTRALGHSVLEALARRAYDTLGERAPDVIHAHSVLPAVLVAQELSLLIGCPYVFTEHRSLSVEPPRHGRRFLELKHAVKGAAVSATVSQPFASVLEQYYERDEVRVLHLPVPDPFFDEPVRHRASDAPYVFLHVSHLAVGKRVDLLLRAFARLLRDESTPEVTLAVAGGTPELRQKYGDMAAELGIDESVSFLGQVSRDELPHVMGASDCLVLPSDYESGGAVIAEARACGVPVITTDTWGGAGNVDAASGLVTPIGDEDELVAAMRSMCTNPPAELPDAEEIRRRARELYSVHAFVRAQVRMYEEALEFHRRPRMVYHAPFPMEANPTAASRLRPAKMRSAFLKEGFAMEELTGFPPERRIVFSRIRRAARSGQRPEFLYSENSTQPNLLATSVKQGLAPLLEYRVFAWARRTGIPAGEFYRDVYWKFEKVPWRSPYEVLKRVSYSFDAWALRRTGVHVFLPSDAMRSIAGFDTASVSALPPGAAVHDVPSPEGLSLFYVGGLGDHYGLQAAFRAVRAVEGVKLTVCVREDDWERNKASYEGLMSDNIRVVHANSNELAPFYADASLCLLFVEPSEYRKFAAPVKFFEYLGYGKPVVVTDGTYAAEMARELGIGVVVPYDEDAFIDVLRRLQANPEEVQRLTERARDVRHEHTWRARAATVARVLRRQGHRVEGRAV